MTQGQLEKNKYINTSIFEKQETRLCGQRSSKKKSTRFELNYPIYILICHSLVSVLRYNKPSPLQLMAACLPGTE